MNEQTQENKSNGTNKFAALKTAVDSQHVKQRLGWRDRNGKEHMVDYVEWHTVADILDQYAPAWTHRVKDMQQIGDIFTVTVAITIDGITREGIGTGTAETELGIKKAEHDALKRAAVKFGVGRDLYKKETELIERVGAPRNHEFGDGKPGNPLATGIPDSATSKQLGMIRAIAREIGTDAEDECHAVWENVRIDQLSKKAASWLIQHLQDLQNQSETVAEVRTGIPSTPVTNVRDISAKTNPEPPIKTAQAPATNAEAMRENILAKFQEIGLSADQSLAGFDRETDLAQKRQRYNGVLNFIIQTKREQISKALADSNWEPNDVDGELAQFGIENGLAKATPPQIEAMWLNYKTGRQI